MKTHPGGTARRLVRDRRGATMVEYAILLFLVLVTASAVYKTVGKKTREAGDKTTAQFM
jgi:Flp pilus assembly pilin Flp